MTPGWPGIGSGPSTREWVSSAGDGPERLDLILVGTPGRPVGGTAHVVPQRLESAHRPTASSMTARRSGRYPISWGASTHQNSGIGSIVGSCAIPASSELPAVGTNTGPAADAGTASGVPIVRTVGTSTFGQPPYRAKTYRFVCGSLRFDRFPAESGWVTSGRQRRLSSLPVRSGRRRRCSDRRHPHRSRRPRRRNHHRTRRRPSRRRRARCAPSSTPN